MAELRASVRKGIHGGRGSCRAEQGDSVDEVRGSGELGEEQDPGVQNGSQASAGQWRSSLVTWGVWVWEERIMLDKLS
jgi:hypothetical protein